MILEHCDWREILPTKNLNAILSIILTELVRILLLSFIIEKTTKVDLVIPHFDCSLYLLFIFDLLVWAEEEWLSELGNTKSCILIDAASERKARKFSRKFYY
jgi:hypothetical protein